MIEYFTALEPGVRWTVIGVTGALFMLLLGLLLMKLRSRWLAGKERWNEARASTRSMHLEMQDRAGEVRQ
ncbi:MAG: hypothetical protein KC910_12175 [Candidatus Eremiobacteraeota bacterium]|nr:hypothetical protein [Candidatus Eremiobacteraeota bacterium]